MCFIKASVKIECFRVFNANCKFFIWFWEFFWVLGNLLTNIFAILVNFSIGFSHALLFYLKAKLDHGHWNGEQPKHFIGSALFLKFKRTCLMCKTKVKNKYVYYNVPTCVALSKRFIYAFFLNFFTLTFNFGGLSSTWPVSPPGVASFQIPYLFLVHRKQTFLSIDSSHVWTGQGLLY